MKSIIAAVVTCAVLFGLSWGVTAYMGGAPDPLQAEANVNPGEESASDVAQTSTALPMPVGLRPENAVSVEAVLQMSDSIKKAEQQLAEREKRVLKQEQRIKLLFDDLATEQDELRAFSESLDAKVQLLDRLKSDVQASLDSLEAKKKELEELAKKTGNDQESKMQELDDRVNEVKGWFSNLEPEQASAYLTEFANNGKLEFAASLLQKMPDRQKSKILGVMSDPTLVQQLIDSLKPASSNKGL